MNDLDKIPTYSANMPHRPIYEIDFADEVAATWRDEWGWRSPFGKVCKVMLCRPSDEQDNKLIDADTQLLTFRPARPIPRR